MLLLDIIRDHLAANGVFNGTTWRCFIGYAPDASDQAIVLTLTGGFPQDTLANENLIETFQFVVRSGVFATCESKWREVYNAVHDADLSGVTGANVCLVQCLASGPLQWYDDKKRACLSGNVRVVRTA